MSRVSFTRVLCTTLLSLAFLAAIQAVAFAQGASSSGCKIFVRLISSHKAKEPNADARKISANLEDVEAQLANLPFDDYRTLDASTAVVPFSDEGVFSLAHASRGTHTVKVRPHEVSGGRVHMTVDWVDPKGETLVSTMLRVMDGHNVMLGAEGAKKSCALVGVRANCRVK